MTDQKDFTLQSRVAFDRVRLLRDQGVKVLICGGTQAYFEELVKAQGIKVVSWVSGKVEELLSTYLDGSLVPGSARLPASSDDDKTRNPRR